MLHVEAVQRAEFRLANASGVVQHRLEYGLQFARRGRDDPEHLRGSSLLLQRLVEFAGEPRYFCFLTGGGRIYGGPRPLAPWRA